MRAYDSIKMRMRRGSGGNIEDLRKKFQEILMGLRKANMLSEKGRKLANMGRLKHDFVLSSDLVNDRGELFLNKLYRYTTRTKKASVMYENFVRLGLEKLGKCNNELL